MSKTRGVKAGIHMADSLLEWAHLMYNHKTARRVIKAMIMHLKDNVDNYQPTKEKEHESNK